MSKKLLYLTGIIITIIIGCVLNYFLCCNGCKDSCSKKNTNQITEISRKKPVTILATKKSFNILDNSSGLAFQSIDNFTFLKDHYNIKDSLSTDMNNQIDRLSIYLNNNVNKQVNVKGLYISNEINKSIFPNLGYARANHIKNYFLFKGISSKQINLSGQLDDTLIADTLQVFYGPVNFTVTTLKANNNNNKNLQKLKDSLLRNPLTLYFKTKSNTLKLTKEQRQKVANLLTYLEKSDNSKLYVTGHTDNTGIRTKNIALAQGRADFVKSILKTNGISESYINTNSKGPDQPIADNTTEKGKAKNRRVTVTIN